MNQRIVPQMMTRHIYLRPEMFLWPPPPSHQSVWSCWSDRRAWSWSSSTWWRGICCIHSSAAIRRPATWPRSQRRRWTGWWYLSLKHTHTHAVHTVWAVTQLTIHAVHTLWVVTQLTTHAVHTLWLSLSSRHTRYTHWLSLSPGPRIGKLQIDLLDICSGIMSDNKVCYHRSTGLIVFYLKSH